MGLYPFRKMLDIARKNGFAIGYFEAWDEYSIETIVEAGEEEASPIIIGFGCMMLSHGWLEKWGIELFGSIGRIYAEKCNIPVSLILNEARSYNQCIRGLELGFNVVMLDSSSLAVDKNIEVTKRLVEKAKEFSAFVEAELGELPVGSSDSGGKLTDPQEAERFVEETDVDALSVSIGNVHVLKEGWVSINIDLLEEIHNRVEVPLVIHGGSGFPENMVQKAISLGVAKFNVGTVLKKVYFEGIAKAIRSAGVDNDYQMMVGSRTRKDLICHAKERLKSKVKQLINLYGSSNKVHLF